MKPRVSLAAHAGFVVLSASLLSHAGNAHAQAARSYYREDAYYVAHGAQIAALLGGSYLLSRATATLGPGADPDFFPGDASLRAKRNERARALSDALLAVTLTLPVAFSLDQGSGATFVNSELIYAETLSLNLWLNGVVKLIAHRPRPYTYGAQRAGDDPRDRFVSFYSGHASTAFAAATAGASMFSEHAQDQGSRLMIWGLEFMLAGATSNLRTRAGKHYYSDVAVGAVVGTTLGWLVPALHGTARHAEASEYGAAALGLGLGLTLSQVIDFGRDDELAWSYAPLVVPHSFGVQALRAF